MKTLFPELTEKMEDPEVQLDGAVGGVDPEHWESPNLHPEEMLENSLNGEEEQELTEEERLALAKSKDVACLDNYGMWERMFAKEKEGCKQTVKNLDDKSCLIKDKEDPKVTPRNSHDDISITGLAPWQDGVLDRLGKEASFQWTFKPKDYSLA